MYSIVRLMIGGVLFLCAVIIVQKSKAVHKQKLYILSAITTVALTTVLAFFPFENMLVTFHSPQTAYTYYTGESDVKLIVEGKNSDFVIGSAKNKDVYLIVPKTADGWKIGIGSNTKFVMQSISDGIILYVNQYRNTNEYYLTILDTNGGYSEIIDSLDSEFYPIAQTDDTQDKVFVTYYSYIPYLDPLYWISINDKVITPFKSSD